MPKGKVKVQTKDLEKFVLSCELSDVTINEDSGRTIGDMSIIEINFKTPSQVFELGRYIDKIK